MDILQFAIIGLFIGYLGGFAGIGGGPFLVALLVLILGKSQLESQGIVLAMMLGPMSLLGVLSLKDKLRGQWSVIGIGVVVYAVVSYFGAKVAFALPDFSLKILFSVLLLIIVGLQFYKVDHSVTVKRDKISIIEISILTSIAGLLGGLFGIGAGVIMVPLMIGPLNISKEFSRAASLAILLPPVSLGAFIEYNANINLDLTLILILFFSYFIANYFGTKFGSNIDTKKFKRFYVILLLSIVVMYWV